MNYNEVKEVGSTQVAGGLQTGLLGVKNGKICRGSLVAVSTLISLMMEASGIFWELVAWLILVAPVLLPLGGVKAKFCGKSQKAGESVCLPYPSFPRRGTLLAGKFSLVVEKHWPGGTSEAGKIKPSFLPFSCVTHGYPQVVCSAEVS